MSSLRKIAEAQKASILAEAERKAAEIDRDMEQLEQLTAKYGLLVTEPDTGGGNAAEVATSESAPTQSRGFVIRNPKSNGASLLTARSDDIVTQIMAEVLKDVPDASITKRARVAAAAYIRQKKRPVPLAELDAVLTANGIKFESDTPRNTLSAVLGQDPNLRSLGRDRGWWLPELGDPPTGLETLGRI